MLVLRHAVAGSALATPVADALPVIVGAWTLWTLLRSMRLYRLGRSERLLPHLARVGVATLVAAGAASFARWPLPAEQVDTGAVLEWSAICGAGLVVLHATWWGLVARWRSQGWLTPNLVVVGATAHAEDLIATAIERRDVNVIGVFDDRRERSPLALLGVPVLGDTDAMLRHRVMPYVDLTVVTIDPGGDCTRPRDHGAAVGAAQPSHVAVRRRRAIAARRPSTNSPSAARAARTRDRP